MKKIARAFSRMIALGLFGAWVVYLVRPAVGDTLLLGVVFVIVYLVVANVYQRLNTSAALFPPLYLLLLPAALSLGAALNRPHFAIEATSARTWLIIALGTAAFAGAQLLPGALPARRQPAMGTDHDLLRSERRLLNRITVAALSVAVVNLATGEIALFADNVNAVRFGGDFGAFGRLWPIVFGVLQAALVLQLIARRGSQRHKADVVVVCAIVGVFVLSAGRAFLALCVVAVAIEVYERRRIALPVAIAVFIGGAMLTGAAGYARAVAQFGEPSVEAAALRLGLPSGRLGSLAQGLVAGPWVLSRAANVVPESVDYRHGGFATADLANFFNSQTERSDRWVTTEVMDREVSSVGGLPPTILGGLWIDYGYPGVVLGMFLFGWMTSHLHRRWSRVPSPIRAGEYAFWCAYLVLAMYSYVSLKPQIMVAFAVFRLVEIAGRREKERGASNANQLVAGLRIHGIQRSARYAPYSPKVS